MINKEFKEYFDKEYNKEKNYKEILSKEKGVVNMKIKLLNIAAIFIVIVLAGVLSTQIYAKIQWDIKFKEYQYQPSKEAKGTLDIVEESGYAEVIDMDYITQDGISIKPTSILLTDDCLNLNLTFKFDENVEVDSQSFSFGYVIYDENKNIYNVSSRIHIGNEEKFDNTTLFIYKELGIKYNKKDIYSVQLADDATYGNINADEDNRTIETNITPRAKDKFPQSKKLYIRIFDPGFSMFELETKDDELSIKNAEDFKLSEAKWNFEIDVPEKFYERNTTELIPENEIPGIEFESITISETGMVLKFKSEEYDNLIKASENMTPSEILEKLNNLLYITDGERNKYVQLNSGTTDEENVYKLTLDIEKDTLAKRLYVNYTNNGVKYTEELIEK